jgi:hypothetical protein
LSAHAVPSKATGRHQEILDGALDDALVEPDFNSQLNPMVRQAVAVLKACNSYEEADAALTALYPQLDNARLRTYMQQALFISDILGQDHARA